MFKLEYNVLDVDTGFKYNVEPYTKTFTTMDDLFNWQREQFDDPSLVIEVIDINPL